MSIFDEIAEEAYIKKEKAKREITKLVKRFIFDNKGLSGTVWKITGGYNLIAEDFSYFKELRGIIIDTIRQMGGIDIFIHPSNDRHPKITTLYFASWMDGSKYPVIRLAFAIKKKDRKDFIDATGIVIDKSELNRKVEEAKKKYDYELSKLDNWQLDEEK